MHLSQFLTMLKEYRKQGHIVPGFLGMGGLGPVGVNLCESTFLPVPDAGKRPFRWPFSGITAVVALRENQFFLAHQGLTAAEVLGLSNDDANEFDRAEGMHTGYDPALRRKILAGYALVEPNPKQMLSCYSSAEWKGRVFQPPTERGKNPLIVGGGIHQPAMWT